MRGFERGAGIFLGARSLLTRATVSAAVCATRRAGVRRGVQARRDAASRRRRRRRSSSRRRRALVGSRRAPPSARPRGDVARARPPRARDALEARVAGRARARARGAPRGVRGASAGERRGVARVARRVGAWGVSTPASAREVTPRGGVFRRGDGPRRGRSGRGRGGEGLRAGRLARHAREESLRLGAKARLLPEDARRFRGGEVLDGDVVVAVECHDEAAIALAGEHPRRHAVRVARAHVAPSEETRRAAPVLVRAPGV